jgi:predicted acylesterase/phospholipase RssA
MSTGIDEVRLPLTAAYGGGGVFGVGYGLGVAHALVDAGIPLPAAPAIGTSAGSWVAGVLALGLTYDDVASLPVPQVPDRRPGLLYGLAHELFGDRYVPSMRAGAVRVQGGIHRMLDGGRLPVATIVAASSAVPGLFAPQRIGRALYVDGGVRAMVGADRAVAAERLVVIAPIAGPVLGLATRLSELAMWRGVRRWERRTGGKADVIRPNDAVAALIRNPGDLFDKPRGLAAYELGREQGAQLVAARADLAPIRTVAIPALAGR